MPSELEQETKHELTIFPEVRYSFASIMQVEEPRKTCCFYVERADHMTPNCCGIRFSRCIGGIAVTGIVGIVTTIFYAFGMV